MTISPPAAGERRLALDDIRLRENVRGLDEAHVDSLAQSIALRGLLVPLIVRPVGDGYELVAGYHRLAACRKLDLPDAPVVVRDQEDSSADSAAENVTSCRPRHEVTNADGVVMPMCELNSRAARSEPGGKVGIRIPTDPGSQTAADDLAEVGLPLDSEKCTRPAPGDRLAFRPVRATRRRRLQIERSLGRLAVVRHRNRLRRKQPIPRGRSRAGFTRAVEGGDNHATAARLRHRTPGSSPRFKPCPKRLSSLKSKITRAGWSARVRTVWSRSSSTGGGGWRRGVGPPRTAGPTLRPRTLSVSAAGNGSPVPNSTGRRSLGSADVR